MPIDYIRYDVLAQEALRGVVRTILADTAKKGLPGEHHFYISFNTCAEGVRLSPRMLGQYPKEMTVVLQHQFWDLTVSDIAFEVGLSFGGIPERLVIPFAAIKGFFDPSVQFGLQFEEITEAAKEPNDPTESNQQQAHTRTPAEHKRHSSSVLTPVPTPANPEPASDAEGSKPVGTAEVVRLDRFRKK
jgi:uncharacterized protein